MIMAKKFEVKLGKACVEKSSYVVTKDSMLQILSQKEVHQFVKQTR